jgi:hypothetical protein
LHKSLRFYDSVHLYCSGTKPTFQYNSSYWTSGATLNDNPSQYAAFVANQTEAVFRPFVNMSGVGVRLVMTAIGAYASRGTGSNLDLLLDNFSSLVGMFSEEPTVYSSPQPGLPAEWWANQLVPDVPNRYVAYTRALTSSLSAWQASIPGPVGVQAGCNLQGVNVGTFESYAASVYRASNGAIVQYLFVVSCSNDVSLRRALPEELGLYRRWRQFY